MKFDRVVRNGNIVTPGGEFTDDADVAGELATRCHDVSVPDDPIEFHDGGYPGDRLMAGRVREATRSRMFVIPACAGMTNGR